VLFRSGGGKDSFDTDQEIKALKKKPQRKEINKKYNEIEAAFKKTASEQGIDDYDKSIAKKLINESAPVILKLKKHHNRPRPYELDKNLSSFKMKSMNTPSYPSGHSAQGTLIGSVLKMKYGNSAFMRTAKNISHSRKVAHAHYDSDIKTGEEMGSSMFKHVKDKI